MCNGFWHWKYARIISILFSHHNSVFLLTQGRFSARKNPETHSLNDSDWTVAFAINSKEIAAERFLSVYTVMTHRKNIFRKLRVNNAQEAIRYALRAGIVDPLEYYI